jgi:hypothetical protein
MLGDEIVFVLAGGASMQESFPLFMAEVRDGQVDSLLKSIDAAFSHAGEVKVAREVSNGILLITKDNATLARARASLGQGAQSDFARDLATRYSRGVSWLWASDLSGLASQAEPAASSMLGVSRMKNVSIEMRSSGGQDLNEASLAFTGSRSGFASWLAAPAPAGSAEYIPTDALGAFSANTRDPKQVWDELLRTVGKVDKGFGKAMEDVAAKTGIQVGDDIIASIGNDFTVALTPPALPVPGWFFAIEVYNPSALNTAIERIAAISENKLSVSRETVEGREWFTLNTGMALTSITWTYDRGYLVMATDRAIARKAIDTRNGGFPLVHSAIFRNELPASGSVHQSAFLWINTQGALSTLAGLAPNPALKSLMENRAPALFVIDGETERIHAFSRTRLTSLVLDMLSASEAKQAPRPAKKS